MINVLKEIILYQLLNAAARLSINFGKVFSKCCNICDLGLISIPEVILQNGKSRRKSVCIFANRNVSCFFLQLFNRPDIFPEPFGVMVKIEHPALCGVKAIAGRSIIEISHRLFNYLLDITILCLIVEGPMFKYDILPLRNVHNLHLFGDFTAVIRREADAIAFRNWNAPAANSARGLVYIGHNLTASAVGVGAAHIVQLSLDAVKQPADSRAVLPRDPALLFPEIPITVALIISDVQILVRGGIVTKYIFTSFSVSDIPIPPVLTK